MSDAVRIVDAVVQFYSLLIFAYVILSWFRGAGPVEEIYRVLGTLCEPYLGLFRKLIPTASLGGAGVDFSPIVGLIVLQYLIRPLLVTILRSVF